MSSRVAKKPITIPDSVKVKYENNTLNVSGKYGELNIDVFKNIILEINDTEIKVSSNDPSAKAMTGTTRALVQNIVTGVNEKFTKKLTIKGVGYRAQAKGNVLSLTLGFSHPVEFKIPEGITIETPSQTEIIVSGADKQKVGQVSANIRAYRPPEPYKGKGVRYSDEIVQIKDTKK